MHCLAQSRTILQVLAIAKILSEDAYIYGKLATSGQQVCCCSYSNTANPAQGCILLRAFTSAPALPILPGWSAHGIPALPPGAPLPTAIPP